MATMALGKTIAFLLYSLLALVLIFPVMTFWLLPSLTPPLRGPVSLVVFALAETALLVLVIRGRLPATNREIEMPISERQLAVGFVVLSVASWFVVPRAHPASTAVRLVLFAALVLCGLVYFVTKSVLSRRLRWGVLGPLFPAIIELALSVDWSRG